MCAWKKFKIFLKKKIQDKKNYIANTWCTSTLDTTPSSHAFGMTSRMNGEWGWMHPCPTNKIFPIMTYIGCYRFWPRQGWMGKSWSSPFILIHPHSPFIQHVLLWVDDRSMGDWGLKNEIQYTVNSLCLQANIASLFAGALFHLAADLGTTDWVWLL